MGLAFSGREAERIRAAMLMIDSLAYRSRLSALHPGLKTGMAAAGLVMVTAARQMIISSIFIMAMGVLTVVIGGIPFKHYGKLFLMPAVFLLFSLLAILVNISDTPLSGYAWRVGAVYLTAGREALLSGAELALRVLGAVSCMYFLALSTPLTDFFYVLKKLKCPAVLIELMMLIYRFIFILLDTAESLSKAQKSRLGNVNFRMSIKSRGQLFTVLFIRAVKRSLAWYDAMEARGYDGNINVLYKFESKKRKTKNGVWPGK